MLRNQSQFGEKSYYDFSFTIHQLDDYIIERVAYYPLLHSNIILGI